MSSVYKSGLAIGLWFMAVVAVVTMLWHEERFFALGGSPIALVSTANRDVSYRSEDDVRWKAIGGRKQVVFDGDKIATGGSSSAAMDFGDGRVAQIGDDTTMGISTIRQAKGLTYIINLPKGSVAIKNSPASTKNKGKNLFPIIIRAGGKDFLIEPGEEKGIVKTTSGVAEFKGIVRPRVISIPKEPVAEPVAMIDPLPPPPPPPPLVKEKIPEPLPPTPEPEALGSEIEITSSMAPRYFTFDSLDATKSAATILEWKEPSSLPTGWRPAIELTSGSNTKRVLLKRGGKHQLTWSDFGAVKGQAGTDGLPCAKLAVRAGAQVEGKLGPKWAFSKQLIETSLCSYKDAAVNVPIVVALSSLASTGSTRPGTFSSQPIQPLKYQIVATTPSQYLSLIPLMSRAGYLRIAKIPGFSETGVFVAKDGKIIMQLSGSGFNASAADQILAFSGADFVFKGPRSSLYDATQMGTDELKEWVSKRSQQGKKVYLPRSGTLLPISRDFLEERREVAAFVKAVASQLFVEKVEIIAFK